MVAIIEDWLHSPLRLPFIYYVSCLRRQGRLKDDFKLYETVDGRKSDFMKKQYKEIDKFKETK